MKADRSALDDRSASPGGGRPLPARFWPWAGLSVAAFLLFVSPLLDLLALARSEESFSHILLMPLIVAYLLYTRREALVGLKTHQTRWALLPALLVLSLLLLERSGSLGLGSQERLSLMIGLLVLLQWSLFLYCFGWTGTRIAAFPLVMMLFLIPLPPRILEGLISVLLWGSAHVTEWMFQLSGVPYLREGQLFTLPGVAIEIADACSGIRSSMALFITGILAADFLLRTGWSRTILVLCLLPLAVFKNGLRIMTLTLLSIHVDPGFLTGDLHHRGGVVFFLATLGVMGVMVQVLRMGERVRNSEFRIPNSE